MPQLTHDAYFKKNGVPELLSPEGFDFAWTQYQTLLVDKLNLLTQGEFPVKIWLRSWWRTSRLATLPNNTTKGSWVKILMLVSE